MSYKKKSQYSSFKTDQKFLKKITAFSPYKSNHNYINHKLKELEQVGQGYAHEKTQANPDIIEKSKRVRFGYLSNIQGAQVTESKLQ